jgi:hypothetical protein
MRVPSISSGSRIGVEEPPGTTPLSFFAVSDAARHLVDEVGDEHARRVLIHTWPYHMPGNPIEDRPGVLWRADLRISCRPHPQDQRHMGQGLYVIDGGGAAPEALLCGEGRLIAGISALAFQGLHEARFFAADVSPCTLMKIQLCGKAAS